MNLLFCLSVIFLLDTAASSLPTPVNVSVHSVNFKHVLHWDPAPGTPTGTQYRIFQRLKGRKQRKQLNSAATHLKLKLDIYSTYYFTIEASYENDTSPESTKIAFSPFEDTIIEPPKVSLAGCGNCIYGNISLPELDSSSDIDDTSKEFTIYWSKRNESVRVHETKKKRFNLTNLERGKEYCVQVKSAPFLNKEIALSDRVCTFTSIVEPSRVPALLGLIASFMIFVIGALAVLMFCLYYTGLLCKLKSSVPRALILEKMVLLQGKIVTVEKTIPDLISISSETDKQRERNDPTRPNAVGGEDDEDDDDDDDDDNGEKSYMYRHAKSSSGESCQDSHDMSEISKLASSTDFEAHDESRTEETVLASIPEWSPSGVEGHVESDQENMKDKEEPRNTLMNVNLFSVTLAAVTGSGTEEEQQDCRDSHIDILKLSEVKPLIPTHSKQTLCHVDSPTETVDQPTVEFLQPTQDSDATWYMGKYKNNCLIDGVTHEEENEEEFSGYMGRI